jgi:hypothetical protein
MKPLNTRFLTVLTTLAFLGFTGFAQPLWADCPHKGDPNHKHCETDPIGNTDDKGFPVRVTFDDFKGSTEPPLPADTIINGIGAPYIGDVAGIVAVMPREGSPPGQFLMYQLNRGSNSTLFFDFGPTVDCASGDPGPGDCVEEHSGDKFRVQCPFKLDDRVPTNSCSGFKGVSLTFRHTIVNGDPESFILGMPSSPDPLSPKIYEGEASGAEFEFPGEKKGGSWRLRFDPQCPDGGVGEYLEIWAEDNDLTDNLPNDFWHIGTGDGSKIACLTKSGKGHVENLVGLFNMQFGYAVCILADPDSGTACK